MATQVANYAQTDSKKLDESWKKQMGDVDEPKEEKKERRKAGCILWCCCLCLIVLLILGICAVLLDIEELLEDEANVNNTDSPTFSPSLSPTTSSPTLSPTTSSPSLSPTSNPTTSPTTSAPTFAPTLSPTTSAPTLSPTTSAPTLSPTTSPTEGPLIPNFPQDTSGGEYCGGSRAPDGFQFNQEILDGMFAEFLAALDKWNLILRPNLRILQPFTVKQGFNEECGVAIENEDLFLDHLLILLEFIKFDGDQGKFAESKPCVISNFPVLGKITLDFTEALTAFQEGFFVKLVQREVAHVLGFGTLWKQSSQGQILGGGTGLLKNPVFDLDGNVVNTEIIPFFVGEKAGATFREVLRGQNSEFPQVEDGVLFGQELFEDRNLAVRVADLFWDFETFEGELMVFQLSKDVPAQLSIMTLSSLQDLGYEVDVNFADPFTLKDGALRGN